MVHQRVLTLVLAAFAVILGDGAAEPENITAVLGRCDDLAPREGVNLTREELEVYGNCIPYAAPTGGGPCDPVFNIGVDYVYIPYTRLNGSLDALNSYMTVFNSIDELLVGVCKPIVLRTLCYYYYPPCGSITHLVPPPAVCKDECIAARESCYEEFNAIDMYVDTVFGEDLGALGLNAVNCNDPGEFINPLPHCCYTAIGGPTPTVSLNSSLTDSFSDSDDLPVIAAVVSSVTAAVGVIVCALVSLLLLLVFRKRRMAEAPETQRTVSVEEREARGRYFDLPNSGLNGNTLISSQGLTLHEAKSITIPGKTIELIDIIGKGEFGIVYRARLMQGRGGTSRGEIVAVKTLKGGMFGAGDVDAMVQEAIKMKEFDHPNVLGLIGVCIDVGEAPYIVMPLMANGSLLSYLKKERANLTVAEECSEEMIEESKKRLLSMCLQIARGMEYLAGHKFVHRDLAARNCMMDANLVIKVADFGLSEDVYMRNYFRQGLKQGVKLPVKWMAVESLHDGIFTEKTDVWSFGVTCWEVFSLGKSPYPGVDPFSLTAYLDEGERLQQPKHGACSMEIYEVFQQCWRRDPGSRPTFTLLVQTLSTMLLEMANYLELTTLSLQNNVSSNSGDYTIGSSGEGQSALLDEQ